MAFITTREYYTVDRSPQEVRNLWDWAIEECKGKLEHENPYAMGVLAAMEYLMGETEVLPQNYKGVFTLENVLRLSNSLENIVPAGDSGINQPIEDNGQSLRFGNPKSLTYDSSFFGGDVSGSQRSVDHGDETLRGNTDGRGGQC